MMPVAMQMTNHEGSKVTTRSLHRSLESQLFSPGLTGMVSAVVVIVVILNLGFFSPNCAKELAIVAGSTGAQLAL